MQDMQHKGLSLSPQVAYLIYKPDPWRTASDEVSAPSSAPPSVRRLRGYALHGFGPFSWDSVSERVVIVDSLLTLREIGLAPPPDEKNEKKGNGASLIGVFQTLPSGHKVLFVPWADIDKRRKRSETWRRYYARQVELAQQMAQNALPAFQWGRQVIGQGVEAEEALAGLLARPETLAVDVETVGEMPDMQITAIGIAGAGVAVSVPWVGYTSKVFGRQEGLTNERIRRLIARILASPAHPKVFHNGGFDRAVFASLGMPCNGEYEDTILQMKIVFPELYRNLQFSVGMAAPGIDPWKDNFKKQRKALLRSPQAQAIIKEQKLKKLAEDWSEIPLDALLRYNAHDAAATLILFNYLAPRLNATHMGAAKYDMMRSLAEMAAEQWLYGERIDAAVVDRLHAEGQAMLAQLVEGWHKIVGPDIPPFGEGSGAKLREYFFKTLRAPVIARSEKTKEPALNTHSLIMWEHGGRQPLSDAAWMLFRIRKLQKNVQAFLEPLKGKDRVYASPNVTGTVGTRFSYSNPNLQQYAKDAKATRFTTGEKIKLAPNVRQCIVAEPGCLLFEADYKALEVRVVAYRTGNERWFEWMEKGIDMHAMHVGLMYGEWLHRKGCTKHGCDGGKHYCSAPAVVDGKELDWNDPDQLRAVTKGTTFARFYNRKGNPEPVVKLMAPKMPTIRKEIVEASFAALDKAVPDIVRWHEAAALTDRKNGYIETGLGGWRIPTTDPPDENRYRSFEIQSTAGHVVSTAQLLLRPRLDSLKQQRMLFQVHDAFVCQGREADKLAVGRAIKESMEWLVPELWGFKGVRFPVDLKCGRSWAEMEALHL